VNCLSYEILEYRDIPNSLARKILEEYIERISSKDIVPELIRVTQEYLDKTMKCDVDRSEKLYNELKTFNLKESTISMIINLLPRTIDELKFVVATFEEIVPDEEALNRILELVNQYCQTENV